MKEADGDGDYRRIGCPKEVSFLPILFNIYTDDQSVDDGTMSFIYADDLCITVQYPPIEEALGKLTKYYRTNSLRANPEKTQVTASHLWKGGKRIAGNSME